MREKSLSIVVAVLLFLANNRLLAQGISLRGSKALIDTGLLGATGRPEHWASVGEFTVSPRGRYVSYVVKENFDGSKGRLVVRDLEGGWRREYGESGYGVFSRDEREFVFAQGDSLHWVVLGSGRDEDRALQVRSVRRPLQGKGEWMAYQENGGSNELVLENLLNRRGQRLGVVLRYGFAPQGKKFWLVKRSGEDTSGAEELWWVDLAEGEPRRIWIGEPGEVVEDIAYDAAEEQGVFVPRRRLGDRAAQGLWYYRGGQEKAELRIAEGDNRLLPGSRLNGWMEFSPTGRWLFFGLQRENESSLPAANPGVAKVDVWGYRDQVVQPDQVIREAGLARELAIAVLGVADKRVSLAASREGQLETRGNIVTGDAVVVSEQDTTTRTRLGGAYNYGRVYYLVSLLDGGHRRIGQDAKGLMNFRFSPDGLWLFYYAISKEEYYSYNVKEGQERCLTKGFPVPFSSDYLASIFYLPAGAPAGWWESEERVLLYDRYDLWGLDPSGRRAAVNLTGGYGARRRLQLRLLEDGPDPKPLAIYKTGDSLILTGFGEWSKENGFVRQVLGGKAVPEVLTMGPYLYYQTPSQKPNGSEFNYGMMPVKAASADCWIVERQTASEAPNYFITTDWRHYRRVSDVEPQAKYKWLRADLVNYRQVDGKPGQGILYKPEDFDAGKRYPVIIHYYEHMTHRLHEFPMPGYTEADLNIPWFVSRGYLVFTPDIHLERWSSSGRTVGQWAYNAVVGAAKYLSALPYVDAKRLGLQGHSFGGWETNYVVTHSHLFAAACEFSGVTDMVSWYLTLQLGREEQEHLDYQWFTEIGQQRMGATLWEHPELYLDQSAVLRADKVSTPMLLVHNKKDGIISWRQGVEWYQALRRLHKPVWMLQYDDGDHSIYGKDARDFSERLTQFFGYYLKGETPPEWMIKGVPAKLKGVTLGLETDTSGRTP